ncbi:MAG TPA: hypothetical protein VEL51_12845 [Vicinamibacterales bacterium]|nr:hypothetical protein [Vicinamibacterales bacterium]
MVLALAGRRVDPAGAATSGFPAANMERVRQALGATFERLGATVLVCSAACGADLLALAEARRAGLRCRLVLPAPTDRFRRTSVVDRGAEWGPLFDELISDARRRGDLVVAGDPLEGDAAYAAANHCILDEAVVIGAARGEEVRAVIVWDGRSRGDGDLTEAFAAAARDRHLSVVEVPTL